MPRITLDYVFSFFDDKLNMTALAQNLMNFDNDFKPSFFMDQTPSGSYQSYRLKNSKNDLIINVRLGRVDFVFTRFEDAYENIFNHIEKYLFLLSNSVTRIAVNYTSFVDNEDYINKSRISNLFNSISQFAPFTEASIRFNSPKTFSDIVVNDIFMVNLGEIQKIDDLKSKVGYIIVDDINTASPLVNNAPGSNLNKVLFQHMIDIIDARSESIFKRESKQ